MVFPFRVRRVLAPRFVDPPGLPGKSRTLCLDNGRADTCVDPDTPPRSSRIAIFTRATYGVLRDGLRGFANGNAELVIDR
jgi:hypothetical protein